MSRTGAVIFLIAYKDMGRTTKHKTRDNDAGGNPPSVFANMPTISLLGAVVGLYECTKCT